MVTIYTTNTCHWCHMAKEYFKEKNIQYEEINVSGNVEKQKELVQKSGQFGVPVIFIEGKMVLGFDRDKINQYLNIKN
jgi:glutaredoxin 3